mgnify:CR=1 FL=1
MSNAIRIPEFRNATFLPMEVEAITNIKPATIRDWRRRGFIRRPDGEGWQRFDLVELAELLVLRTLSDQGIGPQRVGAWLPAIGGRVANHALASETAWAAPDDYRVWHDKCYDAHVFQRFAVILPATKSGPRLVDKLDELYLRLDADASAIAIVLDLAALGLNLRARAKKPLAEIEWQECWEV